MGIQTAATKSWPLYILA